MRPGRALVVGAGFTGLAAAWRLEQAGVEVVVCEAAARPGAAATVTVGDREVSTECALVPALAPELTGLVRHLGLGERVRLLPLERSSGRVPLEGLRRRRLRRLLAWFSDQLDPRAPERGVRLDDRSVADFARVYLGRAWLESRLVPLVEGGFALPADDTSRLLLMLLMDAHGEVALAQVEGLPLLAHSLASRLEDLRCGARVNAVSSDGRVAELGSGERLEIGATLLAIPPMEARRLVTHPLPREARYLDEATAVPRLRLFVRTEAPPRDVERRELRPARDDVLAGVHECGDARDVLCLLARPARARGAADRSDSELRSEMLAALARIAPGRVSETAPARLVRDFIHLPRPGHYRRAHTARLERRSTGAALARADGVSLGPHIEASLTAGFQAAEALLADRSPS